MSYPAGEWDIILPIHIPHYICLKIGKCAMFFCYYCSFSLFILYSPQNIGGREKLLNLEKGNNCRKINNNKFLIILPCVVLVHEQHNSLKQIVAQISYAFYF